MDGRRVLVTGGTGFVGSHVVDVLLRSEFQTRCLVRATSNLRWLDGKSVEIALGDLRNGHLEPIIDGADIVIHCAGLTRGSREELIAANRDGTRALIQACLATGRRIRFVFCSSQAAAGPGRLDQPRQIEDPPAPTTVYGQSKLAAEDVVAQAAADLDVVILRPVGVYGPRDEDTLTFFKLAARGIVVTPGLRKRVLQLVHVLDLAAAIVKAIELPERSGGKYCIAHPDVVDWQQLAEALISATGRSAITLRVPSGALRAIGAVAELLGGASSPGGIDRRKASDMSERAWTCDADRAMEELDWSPTFDLRKGLRDTAEWYRQEGWL